MFILVSGATVTMRTRQEPYWGEFIDPRSRRAREALTGRPWAMDNGAFSDWDPELFVLMLHRFQGCPRCLFVAAPDVVGDATATLAKFAYWSPVVRAFGYPVALVAQNGLTIGATPWSCIDALFIGGDTDFKLGATARDLVAVALARGKWVHMGRVNSARRLRYAEAIGVQSIDGAGWSKFADEMHRRAQRWYQSPRLPL